MSEGKVFEQAPQPQPEPFDQAWYERFEQIGKFQAYEYLDGSGKYRQEERKKFESGEIENPTLDYPQLNPDDLQQKEEALRDLKQTILTGQPAGAANPEKMAVVKQVYRWRLNEKIAEVGLLKAAAEGDAKRFRRYSQFIYGRPSPEVFAYTVHSLRSALTEHLTSDNSDLQQAAQELAAALPQNLAEPHVRSLPSEETISSSREKTLAELGYLINVPEGQGEVDAPVIHQAFQSALESLRSEGWKVVTNPNKENISVNQEQREVHVPQDRRMNPAELKGLILHEIGTHVARREHGERTRLRLLGLGLDRYESGEEGVATMRQQATEEKFEDFAGLEPHLAISLAHGLDGNPRDFRQVYEVIRKYHLVKELAAGTDAPLAQQKAAIKAWNRCVRTFRGTDCQTPGAAFTKDIIYREGNMAVWELIRTNPNEMKRFNIGKYDPTNPRHIWILTELGITEDDLSSLEK